MKATHRGTCQVCGRAQAVSRKDGTLAKHGYTVDWGYFSGVCQGSGERPLEHSKKICEKIVRECEERGDKLQWMVASDIEVVFIKVDDGRDNRGRRQYKSIPCRDDEEVQAASPYWTTFERQQENALRELHREAKHLFAHAKSLRDLIVARRGQELYAIADLEAQAEAEKAEKAAKPTKASVKRIIEGLNREFYKLQREHFSACYAADVPHFLHQYRAAKHAAAFGDDAAKVEELVSKMNEAKASLA